MPDSLRGASDSPETAGSHRCKESHRVIRNVESGMLLRALTILATVVFGVSLWAQKTTEKPGTAGSPRATTVWTLKGATISIEYGRPYLKGRTVGKEVAPFGAEWRTGADQATTLKTDKALTFGPLVVPAGTHTLYTLPGEAQWMLIVSKKNGQGGIPYPTAHA